MRFLFDQNLSDRLVRLLGGVYPGSIHVRHVGLASADDEAVWEFAADRGLAIASKDSDFHQRSLLFGPPPKVIWIRIGNCTTDDVAALLRRREPQITAFAADPEAAFLTLT